MTLAVALILLAFPAGFIGQFFFDQIGGSTFAAVFTMASVLRIAHVVESEHDAR